MKIAILYVCTGNYITFLESFRASAMAHFLPGHHKHFFVFTDQVVNEDDGNTTYIYLKHPGWPDITLERYSFFLDIENEISKFDYVYFFNANCEFVADVGEEFLPSGDEIIVVQHPGYYKTGNAQGLPYETDPRSRAMVPPGMGRYYVAGGVNGGSTSAFLDMSKAIHGAVQADKKAGVIATWHDESHLNRYVCDHPHRLMNPGYCFNESRAIPFDKKIIVKDKRKHGGHFALRNVRKQRAPESKITVELFGRMGNQMFQYAAARAAALRSGADVILDTRWLGSHGTAYELGHFAIAGRPADRSELCPPKTQPWKRFIWRSLAKLEGRYIREKGNAFEPRLLEARGGSEIRGYWQSERYFSDHAARIRQELTFVTPPSAENAAMLGEIDACMAVSVHVRRGDYVDNAKNRSIYASCGPSYYAAAAALMIDRAGPDVRFFVFSDDPDWAEGNLRLPGRTTVLRINGPEAAHEDMRLMAACKHNIIANSSFSWWGAWLNAHDDKIVIGPQTWYLSRDLTNSLITPESWTAIPNTGNP